ncbi:MAG: serine/threonine protein kinase [bacterium]|nr:serine/threonine protein kinase [bacterium]
MRSFGRYEILDELGKGGQAHVYLARDPELKRKIALKVLSEDRLGGSSVERLRREAELASKLDHPNICTVFEAGELDGRPYLAMQYIEGRSLAQLVDAVAEPHELRRQLGPEDAGGSDGLDGLLELFEKAAAALHAAHEAGLVHRDVKPGNLIVSRRGEPMLVDFGLARDADSDVRMTKTGEFMGTPAYMSPEQLAGRGESADRRTDIYSLAATLYEALTLQRPHEGDTWEALCERVLVGTPPDPRRIDPTLPKDLARVLERALEKDPADRYATALAFAEDLGHVRRREPIATAKLTASQRLQRWVRRDRKRATLVGAAALVALASGGTWAALELSGRAAVDAGQLEPATLAAAMDQVRAALPGESFREDDSEAIRDALHDAATELSPADAEDLRRWVVGSLLGFTADFPRGGLARWSDGARGADGIALWNLLATLDPAQFETLPEPGVPIASAPQPPRGDWRAMETEDYVVNFHSGADEAAQEVARELQLLRQQGFERILAPRLQKQKQIEQRSRQVVRIFLDEEAFREFGARPGTSALWSRPRGELGILVGKGDRAGGRGIQRAFGEGLLQHTQLAEGAETPPWLSEGLRDLFSCATVDGKTVRVDRNADLARVVAEMSGETASALEIMGADRSKLYRDAKYRAQAWALTYFLTQVTKNEAWRDLPARLTGLGRKAREQPELVLSDIDWKAVDAAYQEWLKGLQ